MAAFLLDLSRRPGTRDLSSQQLVLPMGRKEIANHLAIEMKTLSRIFSNLVRDGILNVKRRNIEIQDDTGLIRVAGCKRRAPGNQPRPGKWSRPQLRGSLVAIRWWGGPRSRNDFRDRKTNHSKVRFDESNTAEKHSCVD